MANLNRRNSIFEILVVNGPTSLESTEIREYILQVYSDQFSWRLKLDDLPFDSIGGEEALWMERAFEESEVIEVMKALKL